MSTATNLTVAINQTGSTESASISTTSQILAKIQTPAAWVSGNITFKESYDGGTNYFPVKDETGTVLTITSVASSVYNVPARWLIGGSGLLKIVSSVAQTGLSVNVGLRIVE